MIDPTVRAATDADIPQLQLLEAEARAALDGQRGGARWLAENADVGHGWAGLLEAEDVVVGHIDDVVISFLTANLGTDGILRIARVWVTPMARELGFGDEMLAWAIARGKAAGAVGVEGQALPGDRQTKNLWERAGIVARLIVTYKPL